MNLYAVEHVPDSAYCYAESIDKLVLRLRTAKDDMKSCSIFYGDRVCMQQPIITHELPMSKVASDKLFDYYEVTVDTPYTRVCYYFKLQGWYETLYFYGDEFTKRPTEDRTLYFQFPYIRREEVIEVPEWARKAVMYQIFPDSFATSKEYISAKSKEIANIFGEVSKSINGGTIKGITENIGYLADLGIDCLYINPIFTAGEWHKYDTIDYFSIDPCFGTIEDFRELVGICHQNSIKVILDGVFNHSGWRFFAFKDVLEKEEASEYKDWFYDLKFPIDYSNIPNYQCFAYVKEMPKLNTSNQEVIEYFTKVGKFWIEEADIDGWRLDVANEIDHDFWRQFRKAVKVVKPDAFLIAEIWEDAQNWLQGDQFDSAMNYKFSSICTDYFAKRNISVEEFDGKVNSMLMRYKGPITQAQMNLLDSHDVSRFLSRCGENLQRFKLAVLFQMTFVGIPSVYYGDEKGIMGVQEREYRRPMIWKDDEISQEITVFYKKLISIRKENINAMLGSYKTIKVDKDNNIYMFMRESGDQKLLVAMNCSEKEVLVEINADEEKSDIIDLLTGNTFNAKNGVYKVNIGAEEGRIFKAL